MSSLIRASSSCISLSISSTEDEQSTLPPTDDTRVGLSEFEPWDIRVSFADFERESEQNSRFNLCGPEEFGDRDLCLEFSGASRVFPWRDFDLDLVFERERFLVFRWRDNCERPEVGECESALETERERDLSRGGVRERVLSWRDIRARDDSGERESVLEREHNLSELGVRERDLSRRGVRERVLSWRDVRARDDSGDRESVLEREHNLSEPGVRERDLSQREREDGEAVDGDSVLNFEREWVCPEELDPARDFARWEDPKVSSGLEDTCWPPI